MAFWKVPNLTTLLSLIATASAAVISVPNPALCPADVTVTLAPIEIHTSILSNTIVTITPGVTLTVTNAPVCISTLATATLTGSPSVRPPPASTHTPSSVSSPSSASSPASPTTASVSQAPSAPSPSTTIPTTTFLLAVQATPVNVPVVKRQDFSTDNSTSFIRFDAFIEVGCGRQATFVLIDGRLFSQGELLSAPETQAEKFTPIDPPGPVDRTFSLEEGVLHWRNPVFSGGEALFCNLGGYVTVVFNGVYPDQCSPIRLARVPTQFCPTSSSSEVSSPTTTPSTSSSPMFPTSTEAAVHASSNFLGDVTVSSALSEAASKASIVTPAPNPSFVTTTIQYSGTGSITTPITSTLSLPSGTSPGLIAVITPAPNTAFVTTVLQYSGTGSITANVTSTVVLPSGTAPGTIVIITPAPIYSSSSPSTTDLSSTTIFSSPTTLSALTIMTGYDGGPNATKTITNSVGGNDTNPLTVFVSTPYPYLTSAGGYDAGATGGPVTTSIIPALNGTGFVEIQTPYGYLTFTTGYDAGFAVDNVTQSTLTRTISASRQDNRTGTVFISTPYDFITVFSGTDEGENGTSTFTTSASPAGTPPVGTVTFVTPYRYFRITQIYPGQGVITTPVTSTQLPNNDTTTGLIIVQTQPPLATITSGYPGNSTTTSIIIIPSGSQQGTVAVLTPFNYATSTVFFDNGPNGTLTQVQTIFPSPSESVGTILTSLPYPYTFETTGYDAGAGGSATITQTKPPDNLTPTGTVLISTPFVYQQSTTSYDGGPGSNSTIVQTITPSGTESGQVITSIPIVYLFITTNYDDGPNGTETHTTIPPSGTSGGTVISYLPDPYITQSTTYDGGPDAVATLTTTIPAGPGASRTGTIAISTPAIYQTTTVGYDAGARQFQTITSVFSAVSGQAPSVVISTPQPYITITSQFNLTEHTDIQRFTISAGPSGTGTVLIDPPNSYVVTYVTNDQGPAGSARFTSTVLPSGSASGTYIVTVPYRYVTETTGADFGNTATAAQTTTITPNSSRTVGTVLVQTPIAYITSTIGTDEGPGGSITASSTQSGTSDSPPTYFVLTPYPYSTFTTSYDNGNAGTVTIVTTISVTNSRFGSVITSTPGTYATRTTGYDAGAAGGSTITSEASAAQNADGTGTVYISTAYPYVTQFSTTDVGAGGTPSPTAITIPAAGSPTPTGTVISYVAANYITTTVPYGGSAIISVPITSTTPPDSANPQGTVEIQTQSSPVTSVTGYDAGPGGTDVITSTTVPPSTAPTVYISTPFPYVTITSSNSAAFTSTARPSGGVQTGTVIIYTTATIVTPSSTFAPVQTFNCPTDGYFVAIQTNVPSFFSVNIATGQRTLIKSPLGDGTSINAIGYNALDNTLYGVQNTSPAPRIIRIGSDGTVVGARTLPVAPGAYNAGDVDENGEFWIAYQGKNWVHIRLSDQTIIDSGTATFSFAIYDWAYVPGGGNYLYTIAVDGSGRTFLYRFDRTAHTWAQVGSGYGAIYPANGVVGAVYASQDGFLYGSENTQGRTYKFSLDGNTRTFIIQGPTASSNDGAHCINNGAGV